MPPTQYYLAEPGSGWIFDAGVPNWLNRTGGASWGAGVRSARGKTGIRGLFALSLRKYQLLITLTGVSGRA